MGGDLAQRLGGREKNSRRPTFRMTFFRKKFPSLTTFLVIDFSICRSFVCLKSHVYNIHDPFLHQKPHFHQKSTLTFFLISSQFASHPITVGLLLKILRGRMRGPSPPTAHFG